MGRGLAGLVVKRAPCQGWCSLLLNSWGLEAVVGSLGVYRGRGQSKPGCFIEILIAEQQQSGVALLSDGASLLRSKVHVGAWLMVLFTR